MTPEMISALARSMLSASEPEQKDAPLSPKDAAEEQLKAPALNSPLSNEIEKKVEPGVIQAGQAQIKAQDDARLQSADMKQRGVMPVEDNIQTDTSVIGPNGAPMNADALMQDNVAVRDSSMEANAQVSAQQANALKEQSDVNLKIQEAGKGAEELLSKHIEDGYSDLERTKLKVQQQSEAAIANYQVVADEASKMAMQQPEDFFGQAGVNRTLGIVAVMVGGMGVNGNHENRALQQFQAMADRNIAAQKQRFEMLSAAGRGQETLYGMIHQKLGDSIATEAAMRNASLELYKSQMKQAVNQYARPSAKAALDGQLAHISDLQNKNNQTAAQSYLKNGEQILQIKGQENAVKVAQQAAALKNNRYVMENGIQGVIGYVPPSSHERLSKMTAGARTMIIMTNHIEDMIRGHATLASIREYMTANAVQFKGARDFLETGTRIEAGEQKVIDQLNPSNKDSLFSAGSEALFRSDPLALLSKLDAIRSTVTEAAYEGIHTAAPQTTAFDSNDPLWGKYEPGKYKNIAQRQLEQQNGNPDGYKTLDSLPMISGVN